MNQAPREFIRGLHNLRPRHRGCVATIGSFDGVHLGHQAILGQLTRAADVHCLPAVVIIFEPQPHEFFAGDAAPARLTRLREKVEALFAAGVQRVLCLRFNLELRSLSAREFVEQILVEALDIKHLVVGDDFRFGCDRSGDFALLQQMGRERGFTVSDTCTLEIDGKRVSSTRIRQALQDGDFELTARLLGRPYAISGRVVYGRQLGRQLGVPTANVQLQRYRSPLQGVFAITAHLPDGRLCPGVANVGVRPTVSGTVKPLLEVHLLDFSALLYGAKINVVFHHRLRDEQKFPSLEHLRAQLQDDIQQARDYFQNHNSGES
ncbi:bifunctional riboflavin kinase/FAD synthetase [Marinimicrobium sp. ABcell2]|uniref:bifunctional riboflavin kinase/FAD synthetase n=1 Tax=Marinimicrobium sp. ABcell2 TaxID=3069751 RepID=UPI0027AFD8B3|nr:bifunctional riboflavin kinase/FAD synthetase [Marinimicrobium sp. ABcell2]MDQ2078130.1 bifunctional riboflavin kinase/FAD synthetase [Marinimicrobium sp. ABcell2]